MTKKGILEAIKDGQEHSSGGTFDNWITLYIAKAVKDNDTDDAIKKKLDEVREYKNTEYKGGYDEAIHNKIEACRKKFDYPCPSIIQEETLKDVVYIASSDRYVLQSVEVIGKKYLILCTENILRNLFYHSLQWTQTLLWQRTGHTDQINTTPIT